MAAIFQLARVRRSTPSSATSTRVLEIPEATKTILESLTDPLLVVSFLSCSQVVQNALWSAFKHTYHASACGGKPTDFSGSGNSFAGGIWASLSGSGTGPGTDPGAITDADGVPVQVLYLIYRDDGYNSQEQRDTNSNVKIESDRFIDDVLCPLLAFCSSHLNIVSATMSDTGADLKRLCQSLDVLVGTQRETAVRSIGLASLGWQWFGSRHSTLNERTPIDRKSCSDSSDSTETGFEILEKIILETQTDEDKRPSHIVSGAVKALHAQLGLLHQLFDSVECHRPWTSQRPSSVSIGQYTSREPVTTQVQAQPDPQEKGPTQDLRNLTRMDRCANVTGTLSSDQSGRGSVGLDSFWFRDASNLEGMVDRLGSLSENPRIANGAMLYVKMQACMLQLNSRPASFDKRQMRLSVQELVQERALYYGSHAYHRIMNEHLDRQPIPLPWHTLAMIHQDAQSKSLEEIEKRFYAPDCCLPRLLQEFRAHCLETGVAVSPGDGSEDAASASVNLASSMSELEAIVPTGGLYLEYYSANASALQSHHLVTLDEHWQVLLKNRLLSAQSNTPAVSTSSSLASPALAVSTSSSDIKDHASFLLAVDQVRRNYLETCIPSPEAISVLENLDEMQQTESTLFLQSLAATAAAAASASSCISPKSTLPVHLRRYSISSSAASSSQSVPPNGREQRLLSEVLRENENENHLARAGVGNVGTGANDRLAQTSTLSSQHAQQAPTELEQQISEILQSKRITPRGENHGSTGTDAPLMSIQEDTRVASKANISSRGSILSTGSASVSHTTTNGKTTAASTVSVASGDLTLSSNTLLKEAENKSVVQFGWTLHMLHANTLQYAWIWTWLYVHEGSSRQNVVACDSKMYTASKWIILPAKDLVRTRKDWKVSYGDRVWMVSYWFSTRNAKMDLPEYLPRARGAPCRHVIPYGETYVICKTCPADILCMRCFRSSDHTDHTMYLQCSWGTSVCVCGDPLRLKASHALHCSLHCAESEKSYSGLAKGKPCQIKFKPGQTAYRCKTCLTDANDSALLCSRCFRSHNHFGHEAIAIVAEEGSFCSCCDNKSWSPDLHCTYHSPGVLESEYLPRPLPYPQPPSMKHTHSMDQPCLKRRSKTTTLVSTAPKQLDNADPERVSSLCDRTSTASSDSTHVSRSIAERSDRCGHIFQPGEDIYHCRDCSLNDCVVLCSRCFHSSGCVGHQWIMGEYQSRRPRSSQASAEAILGKETDGRSNSPSITVEGLAIKSAGEESIRGHGRDPPDADLCPPDSLGEDKERISTSLGESAGSSCDCGDPEMFRTVFDCHYHLPQEYRPVPSLAHCNYLFLQEETMYRCRDCHFDGSDIDVLSSEQQRQTDDTHRLDDAYEVYEQDRGCNTAPDIWICSRCFDPEQHRGHAIEESINHHNRGLYCHCGDPAILKNPPARSTAASAAAAAPSESETLYVCRDDHNRQNVLCTTDIKEGMPYYSCKSCQTDRSRIFCEPCFIKEAHKDHSYELLTAPAGFESIRCGCGENSAFRFATHCRQHERAGGTNIVNRCRYRAQEGEWVAYCRDCYPSRNGTITPYLCQRCRQSSQHTGHDTRWVRAERDMPVSCACGSLSGHVPTTVATASVTQLLPIDESLASQPSSTQQDFTGRNIERPPQAMQPSAAALAHHPVPSISVSANTTQKDAVGLVTSPPLCQYHTMIYKTTPSTTLYLHSHDYRSINHQDHNEVTGYRYHDRNNDWIVSRPDEGDEIANDERDENPQDTEQIDSQWRTSDPGPSSSGGVKPTPGSTIHLDKQPYSSRSPFLQWKDVFWLKHATTGKYFNSMASLKISQGFQEVSALGAPHSNNDWIIEETTWLRQQILSDE